MFLLQGGGMQKSKLPQMCVLFTCKPNNDSIFVEMYLLYAIELSYGNMSWNKIYVTL